jgi:hypothetical protein
MRLRLESELALRHWGDCLLVQHTQLTGCVSQRTVELRKIAAEVRDVADKRVEDHKYSCQLCKDNSGKPRLRERL